jgi:energy-coupling factor transporter ATP-binding protein EcfA2
MTTLRATPAAVRARGWGWRHAGRRAQAVSGLDLSIEPGERVLLLGASGAGKSTLLSAMAGVLGAEDDGEALGELLIDGVLPVRARGRVGLVLQDPESQVILSRIGDDVAFGCENLGVPRSEIWPRVRAALQAVGLALPLDSSTATLSGGQKQRLALAGVLAMNPGLLLLDEPTANLDPEGVREIRSAVENTLGHSGATFIVIEHRVDVWKSLVNRIVVLAPGGGVLADGRPDEVLDANGRELAESGVWVPGVIPKLPARAARTPSQSLLRAESLAIARRPRQIVRDGIDLEVGSGRLVAITGGNGSGKSTLALTLGGLLPAAGGFLEATARLADGASTKPGSWKSAQLLPRIGSVFQDAEHQFLAPTVREELGVGPVALGESAPVVADRVDELLDRLRLSQLAAANPFTLSGGEKRRLSVGTALATRPRMLILDEPTFGQDARTWRELVALLGEILDEGGGVVAVSHDAGFIAALADSELRLADRGAEVPV